MMNVYKGTVAEEPLFEYFSILVGYDEGIMLDVVLVVDPSLACPKQIIDLADLLYSFCAQNRGVSSCRILGLPGQENEEGEDTFAIWTSKNRQHGYGKSLKIVTVSSCTPVLRATCSFVSEKGQSLAKWSGCIISFVEKGRCETITNIASSFGFHCLHYCQEIGSHKCDEASWSIETTVVEILMWIGSTIKERYPEFHPIGVIASPKRLLKMNAFFPLMPPENSGYSKYFIPIDISSKLNQNSRNLGLQSLLIKYSDFIQHIMWNGENPYIISRALGKFLDHSARDVPLIDTFEATNVLFDRTSMYTLMDEIALMARRKYALPVRSANWELVSERTVNTLSCPYILKSRLACGIPDSHYMALILNPEGLTECELVDPVVAQEYINHHGILFKVYVVGKTVMVEKRPSMPDVYLRQLEKDKMEELPSCIEFDSLNSLPTRLPWLDNGSNNHRRASSSSILTDHFFDQLGKIVREHIPLSVFGFDVVFDHQAGEVLLLDINYFPSFGRVSEAPLHFIDTFLC